jgi:hypothetical protein
MLKLQSTGRGRRYTRLRGWSSPRRASPTPAAGRRACSGRFRRPRGCGCCATPSPAARGARPPAPLRLAFISDLNIGPNHPDKLIDHAFAQLQEAEPDILLMGGDYVSLEVTDAVAEKLAAAVGAFRASMKLAGAGQSRPVDPPRADRAGAGGGRGPGDA